MKQNNELKQLSKQKVTALNIKDDIVVILHKNRIKTLGQLTKRTKTDLRSLDLEPADVNKLAIELQLQGLNLKNNL